MANKLTINLEKSHYVIFHRSRLKDCDKLDVIIQDRIISHDTSTKFLAVIIDDKFKCNLYIILDHIIGSCKIAMSVHILHTNSVFGKANIIPGYDNKADCTSE